jgi:hypothetical protein
MSFFGFVDRSTSIIVSSSGVTKPHYQIKIYVGIIALDLDCWKSCGSGGLKSYWNTNTDTSFFSMDFNDPLITEAATNPIVSKAKTSNRDNFCYDTKYREYWTRVSRLYSAYNDSSALTWTFTCNVTNTTALWGIREFVLLIKACNYACS